jgi:hypothetical protein
MAGNTSPDGPKEYPSEEEIPDEPITVDDIEPFSVNDDNFEDIDDFSGTVWKNQSTPNERIRAVIKRTTDPKSVSEISDAALVSETKSRKILQKLAEEEIIRIHQTDTENLYSRYNE